MQYSIKELSSQWISKSLVYEALKNSLPFSHEFIKNRRLFNEKDLEIFKYYKDFWVLKTVSKYWTANELDNNQPIWKQSQTVPKQDIQQFWNNKEYVSEFIKKTVAENQGNGAIAKWWFLVRSRRQGNSPIRSALR